MIIIDKTYHVELLDVNKLSSASFNPDDYLDFSALIKTRTAPLENVADVTAPLVRLEGKMARVMGADVNRITGEVEKPQVTEWKRTDCLKFEGNDILFHKYTARIGRIGLTATSGFGSNHFVSIRARKILPMYLLLALRSKACIKQLPIRESTFREGLHIDDLRKVKVPRFDEALESEISTVMSQIFNLRSEARMALNNLLDNLNSLIKPITPFDKSFLIDVENLEKNSLDPGKYGIKVQQKVIGDCVELTDCVDIIHPSTVYSGSSLKVLTLDDYSFDGVMPQKLKSAQKVASKNYALPGDILLNRLKSHKRKPLKSTVILPQLGYLSDMGLSVLEENHQIKLPLYEHILILRPKKDSLISTYYLSLVLNSNIMFQFAEDVMYGSTGRSYFSKSTLSLLKVPILSKEIMTATSKIAEASMEALSETLRMIVQTAKIIELTVAGEKSSVELREFIYKQNQEIGSYAESALTKINTLVQTPT